MIKVLVEKAYDEDYNPMYGVHDQTEEDVENTKAYEEAHTI